MGSKKTQQEMVQVGMCFRICHRATIYELLETVLTCCGCNREQRTCPITFLAHAAVDRSPGLGQIQQGHRSVLLARRHAQVRFSVPEFVFETTNSSSHIL